MTSTTRELAMRAVRAHAPELLDLEIVELGYGLDSAVTGAALIIIVVFSGFAAGELVSFQQMGFGVAAALLIDATIVRLVVIPAAMRLLGERNWYLPSWLEWLPHVEIEDPALSEAAPTTPKHTPHPSRPAASCFQTANRPRLRCPRERERGGSRARDAAVEEVQDRSPTISSLSQCAISASEGAVPLNGCLSRPRLDQRFAGYQAEASSGGAVRGCLGRRSSMTDDFIPLTGRCMCGAVEVSTAAPFVGALFCHCKRCQRRSGTTRSMTALCPARSP
jgi:hypothetical protein